MQDDPVRKKIRKLLWEKGMNMREASLAIERNVSYVHGFLERGTPRVLGYQDAVKLAELLGCKPRELYRAERPARRARSSAHPPRPDGPGGAGAQLVAIPEIAVHAFSDPSSLFGKHIEQQARWYLPEAMFRFESGSSPESILVLRVRGVLFEPEFSDGDRLLIDISQRTPTIGEMYVLSGGNGLAISLVGKKTKEEGAPAHSPGPENSNYADCTVSAQESEIVGRLLWAVKQL